MSEGAKFCNELGEPVGEPVEATAGYAVRQRTTEHFQHMLSREQGINDAIDAGPQLAFVYPAEGFPLYCDCAVILRESRRARLAHQFLDYLLRPAVSAKIVEMKPGDDRTY